MRHSPSPDWCSLVLGSTTRRARGACGHRSVSSCIYSPSPWPPLALVSFRSALEPEPEARLRTAETESTLFQSPICAAHLQREIRALHSYACSLCKYCTIVHIEFACLPRAVGSTNPVIPARSPVCPQQPPRPCRRTSTPGTMSACCVPRLDSLTGHVQLPRPRTS